MKKITLFFLLFFFASCQMNKKAGTNPLSTDAVSTDMSCEMFYFIVQRKVYQVTYNGKDSIRTLCGSAKYDMFNLIDKRKLTSTTINFDTIFLDRSKKLTDSQILQLNKCVSRVKTLGKVPKPGVDIKDGWYVYLSVGKLAIYEFKFNLERTQELKDIYELFVTLRKYSPIEFDTNCNGYVMENGYENTYEKNIYTIWWFIEAILWSVYYINGIYISALLLLLCLTFYSESIVIKNIRNCLLLFFSVGFFILWYLIFISCYTGKIGEWIFIGATINLFVSLFASFPKYKEKVFNFLLIIFMLLLMPII